MLRLLPALVLLGALATSAGTSKTCPSCSLLGKCREIPCPSTQDSCLFSQMQLENGLLIKNGSCVAPEKCRESVYTLTYAPHFSVWVSTSCCDNNCSQVVTQPEQKPEAQPNGVKCHYCSEKELALCDSLLVMNCTGYQNVCVTLEGTWDGAGPQTLKGCATPEVCDLQVNTTLGPEAFGFHLTSPPECYSEAAPTSPVPQATLTQAKAKVTTCFTCSNSSHCEPFSCPADKNYCLQTEGFLALAEGNPVAWRNGSCVAPKDCKPDSLISSLTYSNSFGFWINTTCCQGNCQKPTLLTLPVSRTLSKFLCPTCADSHLGLCNSSFYMQCPCGETECVQLDVASEEVSAGGSTIVRGCGSQDLCSTSTRREGLWALFDHQLTGQFKCNSSLRAVIDSGAAPGLRLALPVLVAALITVALS
ncbi:uncharacterized protein LOC119054401 isoform X2 [Artibeus jamaicensis]|uniref:uncharacterized protein LOC119054401 isoform X2 n=1 Tax=Artibeus jamaicensis TaxID=9417 RepID=UPI00235AA2C2|nr:uncharacterized protein LOC119054401 isoform X2 [Artibeus jamaicensis]